MAVKLENHLLKSSGAPPISNKEFEEAKKTSLPTLLGGGPPGSEGGRPTEVKDPIIPDPRKDKDGSRFKAEALEEAAVSAQKKTAFPNGSLLRKRSMFSAWL